MLNWLRRLWTKTPAPLTVGSRVRVVTMNGCMADVRHDPRDGVVVTRTIWQLYDGGEDRAYPMITVRFANGSTQDYPAAPYLWMWVDGLWEYQQ